MVDPLTNDRSSLLIHVMLDTEDWDYLSKDHPRLKSIALTTR